MLLPCLSDIRDKGFYACYAACSIARLFGNAASGLALAAHHEGACGQTKTATSLSCLSDVRVANASRKSGGNDAGATKSVG